MKLSKQTTDAIEILVFCIRPGNDLIKVGEVAIELGLTKQMALKLAYVLNQAGFLEAVRGPKGGVRLTNLARNAKLGEIVRKLELQPFGTAASARDTLFEGYVDEAFDAFLSVLDQHTLDDLSRRRPAKQRVKNKNSRNKASPLRSAGNPKLQYTPGA